MLTNLELINFKSISNNSPIGLKEYTILSGSNSSGKSSIIQALLMISQTFTSRFSQGSIALNGHLIRLGAFADIKSSSSDSNEISIKFEMEFGDDKRWLGGWNTVKFHFSFGNSNSKKSSTEDELHPAVLSASVSLCKYDGSVDVLEIERPLQESREAANLFNVKKLVTCEQDTINREYPDFKILGCAMDTFLPNEIMLDYDHTKKISSHIIEMLIGQTNKNRYRYGFSKQVSEEEIVLPSVFFHKIKNLITRERTDALRSFELPEELKVLIKNSRGMGKQVDVKSIKEKVIALRFGLSPEVITDSFIGVDKVSMSEWLKYLGALEVKQRKLLTEFIDKHRVVLQDAWYQCAEKVRKVEVYRLRSFTYVSQMLPYYFERSMKYLGPLRNEPQPMYPALGLAEPTNVGMKGEYSAAILHINKSKVVKYPSPCLFGGGERNCNYKVDTLERACIEWLSYLGVVEDVRTNDKGKLGYELSVKTHVNDNWQDLTHVGVGVSQVLPIVLMSLLSEADDLLIFEQPELHLHPKVQSRLCDFFIAISAWERQCIIETHSEYLINRLRLRIAESRDESILSRCSILFLDKVNGITGFRTVDISEYGAIVDWPEEFFDQTDKEIENILIEATKKKRMKRLVN